MSTALDRFPDESALRRLALRERRWSNTTFYLGAGLVGLAVVVAVVGRLASPYDPNEVDLLQRLQAPSLSHPFGTDTFGRDIATRVLYALGLDLQVILVITYLPLVVGMVIGAYAGYRGGWADAIAMRVVDGVIAFPFLVLMIAIVAIVGAGLEGVYIGVLAVGWALYARLTRGEMLVLREQDFMLAGRALGYSQTRLVFRHAMPNLLRSNVVFSAADLVLNLLLLASLSYLGLGVQPPTAELGAMVAEGQSVLRTAWWVATIPGLVIVALGVAFSMVGDGLADRLGRQLRLTL
ncbi:MAG: ABC transporter permease [Gaiellales bacterium]